jgi:hypothetical protein
MTDDERMLRLLDKDEIIALKCAFARAADARLPDRMAARFTEDCTVSYVPGEPAIHGREPLGAWYAERLGTVASSSHHLSNFEITFPDRDTALLRCYVYSWQRFADYPADADRHRWGRYADQWVRTDSGWFQSTLRYLLAGEVSADPAPRVGEYFGWDG